MELWKRTKRVMQCGDCLSACDYYQIFPQEKALEEQAETERKRKEADAAAQLKVAEERANKLKQEAEQKAREETRRRKELEIDDELAKLKKKLGK